MSARHRGSLGAASAALSVAAASLLIGTAVAQTVQPHPDPRHQALSVQPSPPPAGVKAVRSTQGWVLQLPEGPSAAESAKGAAVPTTHLRAVATPSGAWLVEDARFNTPAAAAVGDASLGPKPVLRLHPTTGQRLLELPGSEPVAARPDPPGLREVVLRSSEDLARALLQPEPLVRYRNGLPQANLPRKPG